MKPAPKHPTHAIRMISNRDGEENVITVFGYMNGGVWRRWEGESPLIEFEGDRILNVWPLMESISELRDLIMRDICESLNADPKRERAITIDYSYVYNMISARLGL